MEAKATLLEPLLESVKEYGKTSLELLKLKSLGKTADIASTLVSRLILAMVLVIFAITLNIAIGFWLGEMMGKTYYGFLVVAFFYGVIGLILVVKHPSIKARVNDSIITLLVN